MQNPTPCCWKVSYSSYPAIKAAQETSSSYEALPPPHLLRPCHRHMAEEEEEEEEGSSRGAAKCSPGAAEVVL